MPFNPEAEAPGDLIRAEDWNAAMDEVVRLETDKLSRTGTGQVAGGLTLTGSLGVGTATRNRKVTVQDAGNCYLNVRANGGAQEVLIGADAAGGIVSSMTNHDLILRAGSNSEKVRIKVDGKVGIGTDAPDSTLHVRGGAEPVVKIQSNVDGSISARLALRQGDERGADLYFDGRDGDSTSPRGLRHRHQWHGRQRRHRRGCAPGRRARDRPRRSRPARPGLPPPPLRRGLLHRHRLDQCQQPCAQVRHRPAGRRGRPHRDRGTRSGDLPLQGGGRTRAGRLRR